MVREPRGTLWGPLDSWMNRRLIVEHYLPLLLLPPYREKSLPHFYPRDEFKRLLVILFIFMPFLAKSLVIPAKFTQQTLGNKFREFYYSRFCRQLLSQFQTVYAQIFSNNNVYGRCSIRCCGY